MEVRADILGVHVVVGALREQHVSNQLNRLVHRSPGLTRFVTKTGWAVQRGEWSVGRKLKPLLVGA
jgi:hypothetical protein